MADRDETEQARRRYRPTPIVVALLLIPMALLLAVVWAANVGDADAKKTLLDNLLDWPVLAFAVLMMLFGALGSELAVLVRTRNIKIANLIEFGDEIRDLEAETGDATAELEARVAALEAALARGGFPAEKSAVKAAREAGGAVKEAAREAVADVKGEAPEQRDRKIYAAIRNSIERSRFTWRSLERLGAEVGLGEAEVARILQEHGLGEVRMSIGKSGRRIARIQER